MRLSTMVLASVVGSCLAGAADAVPLRVTLTNISPVGGVGVSPLWVGFHDGSFDVFSPGSAASSGVERTAEDGDNSAITALFTGSVQGTLPGDPAFPGDIRSALFDVDTRGAGRYFSYLSMVVVSNDFFIGNGTPTAIDLSGLKPGETLSLLAGQPFQPGRENVVYDAGTEVNDFQFSLANAAFGIPGGQTGPDQGTPENGVVTAVQGDPFAGFLNVPPGFTSGPLDFNDPSIYQAVARIDITAVPEPASLALLLGAVGAFGAVRLRGRQSRR
jgi:hypothetical protein